jgi:NADH:ubiquinone oxidoreductase subunit E
MGQYKHHVFICTSGKTCPTQGSKEVHETLKKGALELGLKGVVRINHAGCMNQCGMGQWSWFTPTTSGMLVLIVRARCGFSKNTSLVVVP